MIKDLYKFYEKNQKCFVCGNGLNRWGDDLVCVNPIYSKSPVYYYHFTIALSPPKIQFRLDEKLMIIASGHKKDIVANIFEVQSSGNGSEQITSLFNLEISCKDLFISNREQAEDVFKRYERAYLLM